MAEDWEPVTIGELGRVVTGKTPPTRRSALFGDAYPFITPTDINGQSHVVRTDRFLSEEGRNFQTNLLLPAGTVSFVCIGATIGKICMVTRPSFTNQQINSVVVTTDRHDPRFVYYLLKHEAGRIKSIAGGAATPIVNKTAFSNVLVRVPPIELETRIGTILAAYDELIENNARRIKILEEMAQALYREWFVHFRFPGHEEFKLITSVVGKIPHGWEIKKLGEIANVNASSIKPGQGLKEIDYVDISSVTVGRIGNVERYALADAPGRARRIVTHGDIIWSCVRPNRKSYALILNPKPNLIVSTGFAVISASRAPYTYLYHALTTDDFVGYLTNRATGAAYPAVTAEDFINANILLPPSKLLDRFDGVASSHFELIHDLYQINVILGRTRDLLLPKLISGELRV